ncbi:MAG: formate/nitrite transporter family protein, partial [Synechococcaceae cyanobacterium]|nr:formate/nitrite transporter family protein [Synechococcaceae cyanobacterium]
MDYVLPNELVDGMIMAGSKKAGVSIKNLLLRGFYSGSILGLAVCLALTVAVQSRMAFVGSLVFPFGFASIVLFGMELVTGNFALLPMATWAGRCTWSKTIRNWIWVWIGNFLGCLVVSMLMAFSFRSGGIVDLADAPKWSAEWAEVASKIIGLNKANVVVKYEALGTLGFLLAILRGLIANWLVCLGVTLALVSKSVPGKILACWLPIMAFQTLGMEHIVVNMFLHTAGPLLGSGVPFAKVIFWNFLPVTIGNIIGGMVFIGML